MCLFHDSGTLSVLSEDSGKLAFLDLLCPTTAAQPVFHPPSPATGTCLALQNVKQRSLQVHQRNVRLDKKREGLTHRQGQVRRKAAVQNPSHKGGLAHIAVSHHDHAVTVWFHIFCSRSSCWNENKLSLAFRFAANLVSAGISCTKRWPLILWTEASFRMDERPWCRTQVTVGATTQRKQQKQTDTFSHD